MMQTNVIARYAARTKTKYTIGQRKETDECLLDMYSVQRLTRDRAPTIAE